MKQSPHILVIEASEQSMQALANTFQENGIHPVWQQANSVADLHSLLASQEWDMVLLDSLTSMLPVEEAVAIVNTVSPKPVSLVALLPHDDAEKARQIIKAGVQRVVVLDQPENLLQTVKKELEASELRHQVVQLQQMLQKEQAVSRYYLQAAGVIIVALDAHYRVTLINRKGSEVLGYSEEDILGKNWLETFVPERNRSTVESVFQKLFRGETECVEYFEYPVLTHYGDERMVAWHDTMVHQEGPHAPVILTSGEDITENKMIHQRKETFVATLTHDLNTPIRAEFQVLELLLSGTFGPLTQEQKEVLNEILRSNRFMQRMVDSLLAIFRYEDHQVELKFELVNLNDLIYATLTKEIYEMAREKAQNLRLGLAENLSPVWLDTLEIQRVLGNLVRNAIIFSDEGATITVTSEIQGQQICVSVEDTGRGIEPEMMKTLFNRYSSIAKKFRQVGTGLSLYLSRQIIEAHGGHIGAESQVGKGSRFFFTLPIATSSEVPLSVPKKLYNRQG